MLLHFRKQSHGVQELLAASKHLELIKEEDNITSNLFPFRINKFVEFLSNSKLPPTLYIWTMGGKKKKINSINASSAHLKPRRRGLKPKPSTLPPLHCREALRFRSPDLATIPALPHPHCTAPGPS